MTQPAPTDFMLSSYAPILIVFVMAAGFAAFNQIASSLLGPKNVGATKGTPVESGMDAIGTTRKRFNIRFYVLAMTFLVFDVEIIFLYPWAVTFTQLTKESGGVAVLGAHSVLHWNKRDRVHLRVAQGRLPLGLKFRNVPPRSWVSRPTDLTFVH